MRSRPFKVEISGSTFKLKYNFDQWSKLDFNFISPVLSNIIPKVYKNSKFLIFKVIFRSQKSAESFWNWLLFKNIESGVQLLKMTLFVALYFLKLSPTFIGSLDNFSKRYKKSWRFIFDQSPKLYISLNEQAEIQILKVMYTVQVNNFQKVLFIKEFEQNYHMTVVLYR